MGNGISGRLSVLAGLIALAVGVWLLATSRPMEPTAERDPSAPSAPRATEAPSPIAAVESVAGGGGAEPVREEAPPAAETSGENESPKTPEERNEEAEEAAVESFDNLTDKWMEPSAKGVTLADVDGFVAQFRKLPPDRREECLQRALNLVPDENVMLLAGVLMDKSQPKELLELVFNDILNRDEDVKNPILREVFRDKTHPCRADAAWILDATGEQPAR